MGKFINDLSEVGRDIWDGFVWIVEAADNAGEAAGNWAGELTAKRKKEVRLMPANERVKNNCVSFQ